MSYILLICESKRDAMHLLGFINNMKYPLDSMDVLSMHPEVQYTLESHNISTITSTDYIQREDYDIINTDCEKIYLSLEESVKKYISGCYSPCVDNMFMYYVFFAFYTIVWNYRLLNNLLSNNKYNTVILFKSPIEFGSSDNDTFPP